MLSRSKLYLAAIGGFPEAQLRERLPGLTKIASWQQIGPILNAARPGLALELEYTPPGALPVKPGLAFFRIARTPEFWNDIAGSGTIAVYAPPTALPMEIHLYMVDPTNL
jgi:type VI secretion system protein ImpJ